MTKSHWLVTMDNNNTTHTPASTSGADLSLVTVFLSLAPLRMSPNIAFRSVGPFVFGNDDIEGPGGGGGGGPPGGGGGGGGIGLIYIQPLPAQNCVIIDISRTLYATSIVKDDVY